MNPLSPLTYYKRHKGKSFLLVAIITLATLGLFLMVAILDSIPLRANGSYLNYVSRVYPTTGDELEPSVVSQLQVHPDVAHVVHETGFHITYPVLIGTESLRLLGVSTEDARYLIEHEGLQIKEGRLFEARSNEVVLTAEVTRALNLQVGDTLGRSVDKEKYKWMVTDLTLVGILAPGPKATSKDGTTPRYGFISGEYLDSHELYVPRRHNLVIVPATGRLEALNTYLDETIQSAVTGVETIDDILVFVRLARQGLYVIFGLVNVLVAIVIALVVATINRIALMERVEELGALNALGFDRRFLTRRMIAETALISALGWLSGTALSLVTLQLLKGTFFYNLGADINVWNLAPFLFIIPMPLAVILSAVFSIRKVFASLDAVQILERGKLSTETKLPKRSITRSSTKPLSSFTFYQRHRRRGTTLVVSMSLMILGVAFPAFLLLSTATAMKPEIETLRHMSEVYPVQGKMVDAGVTATIRNHPGVERVIAVTSLGLQMNVPPGGATTVALYGLPEDEMPYLMERMGLYLQEGQLPRQHTNDLILSASVAKNRGLGVGDRIGDSSEKAEDPLVEDQIPTELVVSGILGPDVPWVGFISSEFLRSHELTRDYSEEYLLVVATPGNEQLVSTWLRDSVSDSLTRVTTYRDELQEYQEMTGGITLVFALVESLIAVVAAVALATLNYIFFSQRKDEFGILNALGRSYRWLTMRILRETGSTVFVAWLIGAGICLLGLVLAQQLIYAPLGLKPEIGNLIPWAFTLPIPLTVVLASTGTISRMLRKLDPVTIIERRS
jgi:ABC-type lipoprotein release transport system permease subunit